MPNPTLSSMTSRTDYDNESTLLDYLGGQLALGNLCLVLGAGVSNSIGLMGWEDLLVDMFDKKGGSLQSGRPLESEAERFRLKYYNGDNGGFVDAIRQSLYDGISVNFKDLRKNDTLAAIGALVMSSIRGSASEVITFNFDNLLEMYLEYHGFVTNSVTEPRHWAGKSDVTIIHPHGFIPNDKDIGDSSEVVFDQRSFASTIGDEANLWRQKVATLLRTHTCIFIGLSGDDLNLDSILLTCKQNHAGLESRTAFWGISFTTSPETFVKERWEARGVYCKRIDTYDVIPDFLFKICQLATISR